MHKITPVSHTQPSESSIAEYFNVIFLWNPIIRPVLFSLYRVWLHCVLFILSPFHCLVHSQWVAFTMLDENWNFTDLDLLQRLNSKVPFIIGELNTQVPSIVVDKEKLRWKAKLYYTNGEKMFYAFFWVVPGVWILYADVSEHFVCSFFIGG